MALEAGGDGGGLQPCSCPECRGILQGGRRSRLLSFVNGCNAGCNAVMGVVAEPSACGLQPASPASSQPTCVCNPEHPGAAPQLLPKPGASLGGHSQVQARDGTTLALANCVHMSFPSSCQGATWRKAAPTQMGTPPPLPFGVPKMPGGVLGIFKWLKLQPNTPQDK